MAANLPHALACVWQLCRALSCVSPAEISEWELCWQSCWQCSGLGACHSSLSAELAVLHGQSLKLAPVSKQSGRDLQDSQGAVYQCYSSVLMSTLQTWQMLLQQLLSFLPCHAQSQASLGGNMNSHVRLFVSGSQVNVIVTLLIFINKHSIFTVGINWVPNYSDRELFFHALIRILKYCTYPPLRPMYVCVNILSLKNKTKASKSHMGLCVG